MGSSPISPTMNKIYEDQYLLVIDKNAGIDVSEIETSFALPRNGLIHRIDKDTSGLLLIAKNENALNFFQKQFQERTVRKTYIALVNGIIDENEGIIDTLIGREGIKQKVFSLLGPESKKTGPRPAKTAWRVVRRYKEHTLVEASPKTGRKHQIRVHMAHLGFPIVGDRFYSFRNQQSTLQRHFLHAKQITIKMLDGDEKTFTSELPEELKKYLENL
jgi:23S rRNA pseudouridine1911/1915/1917 synthase